MNYFNNFQKAIDLKEIGSNDENVSVFELMPDENYFVGRTPHGGYLMAVMQKALLSVLPHEHAINLNTHYLDRTDLVKVKISVETLRISKGSSVGQVKLIQDGKITCAMTGLCSDFNYMKGVDDIATQPPNIFNFDRDDFVDFNYDLKGLGYTPNFVKQVDCSIYKKHAWWLKENANQNEVARCSGFVEMSGGKPNQFVLAFYSDFFPPVVMNKYGALGWVPTLSLTTNIRQIPTTEKLFMDVQAKDLKKGFFEQDCIIWDLNENLVATSRQLTRILKSEDKLPHLLK